MINASGPAHGNNGLDILEKRLQLGVVWRDVDHHIKSFALRMCLINAQREVLMVEFIISDPKAIPRLPRVDGTRSISEGVTHGFERTGRGEEFGLEEMRDAHGVATSKP
ncbi:hypothetical protein GCM10009425_22950 [Pseudomonas asuensis]|uniref:Uncharacterized protein n=1 Tax=Pseudomonas asuensis TaxID=1825787 RepID=A0ABQ2GUF0_9PSED|nr:hypothetical protein GCM10009425_22950 [Pseudomonas asuensis]